MNKELVIVHEDDDPESAKVAAAYECEKRISVHVVRSFPRLTLGELRNLSIEVSTGEYFCQWDDDDWYHAERVALQVRTLIETCQAATALTNWLLFDTSSRQAYLSQLRLWEGSILCRNDIVDADVRYSSMRRMEDSCFTNSVIRKCGIFPLVAPVIYVHEIHGGNTWNRKHFDLMLSRAQPLSATASQLVGDIMAGKYSVRDASDLLSSREFLQGLRYFHVNNIMPSDAELRRYAQKMENLERGDK